jgi:hypothetical protein
VGAVIFLCLIHAFIHSIIHALTNGNAIRQNKSAGQRRKIMSTATAKAKAENGNSKNAAMEVKKNDPKVENPVLTLEKRIQKVEELNIIIEKWRKLNEAKKNLTGFKLGNDGLSSTITLKDAAGREFKTSHNLVVTTVLDTLQKVLDEKIIEVEAQIDFAG